MGVIINIDESAKLSAFNIRQEPIKMLLTNEVEVFEKGSILNKIYAMRTMDTYQQEYRSSTKMGNFEPTEDLEKPSISDFDEGYGKTFKTHTWTNSFVISKQAIEDNQDLTINQNALGFLRGYYRTRELYGVSMLAGALTGSCVFGAKKKKFDCRGFDTVDGTIDGVKQIYFHNKHKSVVPGVADQSNKFRASIDLNEPMAHEKILRVLGEVETAMQNYTDYNGNPVGVDPKIILVSNEDYKFKDALLTALKTPYTSAMGDNGMNLQVGKWEVVVTPYLNAMPGFKGEQAMVIIDPKANKENFGAVWFDRVPLTVDSYVDKGTKANIWDGRARFAAGFADFRPMAYVSTKVLGPEEVLNTVAEQQHATPIDVADLKPAVTVNITNNVPAAK